MRRGLVHKFNNQQTNTLIDLKHYGGDFFSRISTNSKLSTQPGNKLLYNNHPSFQGTYKMDVRKHRNDNRELGQSHLYPEGTQSTSYTIPHQTLRHIWNWWAGR